MGFNNSEKINAVMDSVPIFLVVARIDDQRIIYCNQMARQLFGDGIGKTCDEFFCRSGMENKIFTDTEPVFDESINDRWYHILNTPILWDECQNSRLLSGVDITDIKVVKQHMPIIAEMDPTTGLFNRQTGLNYLEYYLQDVVANNNFITVCSVKITDPVDSEWINDECIKAVVSCVQTSIRRTDIFARIDSNDFLMLLPNCQQEVVENIMSIISNKLKFINEADHKAYSIAYGVAEVNGESTLNAEHVLSILDEKVRYMKESSLF